MQSKITTEFDVQSMVRVLMFNLMNDKKMSQFRALIRRRRSIKIIVLYRGPYV